MNPHEMKGTAPTLPPNVTKMANDDVGTATSSRKRTHDVENENNDTSNSTVRSAKVPKVSALSEERHSHERPDESQPGDDSDACTLLTLSDDVLLQIFLFLDSITLSRLCLTCRRLSNICSDPCLWKKVDSRGSPLTVTELRGIVKYFGKRTSSITIHGFLKVRSKMHVQSLTSPTLNKISEKCPELREFHIKDCFIDAKNGTLVYCKNYFTHTQIYIYIYNTSISNEKFGFPYVIFASLCGSSECGIIAHQPNNTCDYKQRNCEYA